MIKLIDILSENNSQKLTSDEYAQIEKKFGKDRGCSIGKDDKGYYCYTHRARSKSVETINKITKKDYDFICSTS